MTRYHLTSLVLVRKLNPARRLHALKRMRLRLDALPPADAAALRARIDASIALQRRALVTKQSRRTSNEDVMHADGARALDSKLDKLLSLFNDALGGFIDLFGGQKALLAKKIREAVLRDGVAPITSRTFVEQNELLNVFVHDLRSGDLATAIAELKLEEWVDRLDELNTAYGQQLTRPERVEPSIVRAADLRAFVGLLEVVTGVLSLYPTDEGADIAGREHLLAPLAEQEQEAAMLRARQRNGSKEGAEDEDLDEDELEDEAEEGEGLDEEGVAADEAASPA